MPILRLNSGPDGLTLHGSPAAPMPAVRRAAMGTGPVVVLVHGFKYDPDDPECSPHSSIFGTQLHHHKPGNVQWLRHLGFGCGNADEGLAIAFAWRARGNLWRAQRSACAAGRLLGEVIATIRQRAPHRQVHVVTHSMGSEVIFEALGALPAHAVQRIIALSGASYSSRAVHALQSEAGRTAELLNITSRENDLFDFIYERLIAPPVRGDGAMGLGLNLPNVVNIQIDCARTLTALGRFGVEIAPPLRRICHWSSYSRPGALRFYARALRDGDTVNLSDLRAVLPKTLAPRWSLLLAPPRLALSLPAAQKAA